MIIILFFSKLFIFTLIHRLVCCSSLSLCFTNNVYGTYNIFNIYPVCYHVIAIISHVLQYNFHQAPMINTVLYSYIFYPIYYMHQEMFKILLCSESLFLFFFSTFFTFYHYMMGTFSLRVSFVTVLGA